MISRILLIACLAVLTSAWSLPYQPAPRQPMRFTRFAPRPPRHLHPQMYPRTLPQHRITVPVESTNSEEPQQQRPKRGHHDYDHHHGDQEHRATSGTIGPVHTFVKTDKNANYKWGVRHHVGDKYAS